jgi:glyoxylase-like metal-dependent hydrolase (beta-lactamase superfamily II)
MKSTNNEAPGEAPRSPTVTAEGEAFPSDPQRLRYTDAREPASGHTVEIAPGVRWGRIPLPLDLNHINVWLIDADDGCIVVDTGIAAGMGKDAWEKISGDVFSSRPLRGVFITHIHPDHIGLAAWLQGRHDAPVWMSARTHAMAEAALGGHPTPFSIAEDFFRANGLNESAQLLPMFKPERFIRMTSGLPRVERFVADGEILQWNGDWTALETNGHAEGHLCLWNADARVLISGDQVLPAISSNISFTFRSTDRNPLDSYLSSLERLRTLPSETLVLPSHGAPFYGLHQRIDDLTRHHREQLDRVMGLCREPKTAADLLPHLFRRDLKGIHLFLALGEALAHLEYLVHAGRLERQTTEAVVRYVALRSG